MRGGAPGLRLEGYATRNPGSQPPRGRRAVLFACIYIERETVVFYRSARSESARSGVSVRGCLYSFGVVRADDQGLRPGSRWLDDDDEMNV